MLKKLDGEELNDGPQVSMVPAAALYGASAKALAAPPGLAKPALDPEAVAQARAAGISDMDIAQFGRILGTARPTSQLKAGLVGLGSSPRERPAATATAAGGGVRGRPQARAVPALPETCRAPCSF